MGRSQVNARLRIIRWDRHNDVDRTARYGWLCRGIGSRSVDFILPSRDWLTSRACAADERLSSSSRIILGRDVSILLPFLLPRAPWLIYRLAS